MWWRWSDSNRKYVILHSWIDLKDFLLKSLASVLDAVKTSNRQCETLIVVTANTAHGNVLLLTSYTLKPETEFLWSVLSVGLLLSVLSAIQLKQDMEFISALVNAKTRGSV
jgi:hypothetical protein